MIGGLMAHQIRDRGVKRSPFRLTNYFRSAHLFEMNKHLKPDQNAQAQAIFDCGCVSYRQRFLKNKKFKDRRRNNLYNNKWKKGL